VKPQDEAETLAAWRAVPGTLTDVVRSLDDAQLDRRIEKTGMTVREQVHHLVEAQVVAASIAIAGLGMPGSTYDWSWMQPFGSWMERLPYRSLPLALSLDLLRALNAWVAAVAEGTEGGLSRELSLRDSPDAALRKVTVGDVLRQEVEHAEEHVLQIRGAAERS
jgi:hypothetical protein